MSEKVRVELLLDDGQAEALAQFVKRVGWAEFRACAVDDAEAYCIKDAVDQVMLGLREAGYSPR